jgi:hypothetical protein
MLLNSILLIVVWLLSLVNWCFLKRTIQLFFKKTIDAPINIDTCEASFIEKLDHRLGLGYFTLGVTWVGFGFSLSSITAIRYPIWAFWLATLYEAIKCAAFISRAQFDKSCCASLRYVPTEIGSNIVRIYLESTEIAVSSKQIFIELYELDALQYEETGIQSSNSTRIEGILTSPDCVEFLLPNSEEVINKLKRQSKRLGLSFGNSYTNVLLYLIVEREDKTFTFCWR